MKEKGSSFSGSIGFVLAAAGSAVGVGNIWRFPYLCAKDGGGLFLLVYLVLVLTFGFVLLTTDVALGRKTKKNALRAFESLDPKWKFLGHLTFMVPALIMTYYSVIGGWIVKYFFTYIISDGKDAASDVYFTSFITSDIAPVVFMLIFSYKQNRQMQETFMDNRRKIGDVNSSLQDTLAGIRVVQSFANEKIEREKFEKSNEGFLVSKDANYHCMGSFMSGNLFFQGMMYLITLVFGGWLIAHGKMEAADLAMYALYIGIFISPIQILVELTEMMQKGLSGFRRFLDVVETEPEIVNAPDAEPLENVKGEVEYKNVSFHYSDDDTPVLDRVSFKIPAGRSIALVGPSGSGKTTICSLLPRFYDVTGGVITIDGQDVRKLTLESLRSQIGLVQQDVYLFCGSIRENIAYGKPGASMEEIIDAAKKANIHEFIMSLPDGYESFVGERGTRLSGGQKQRISIARVFLKNPPILILDEATSALDNESERWIQQSLEELAKNRTTITIAHRLSTIRNADEILVVANNGIAERGNHDELLEQGGIYAHYYEMS